MTTLLTALGRALWPMLARHLRAIGRRLLTWIRNLGYDVIGWMRRKVITFEERRARARTARRRRWLDGRIRRWTAAADWLATIVEDDNDIITSTIGCAEACCRNVVSLQAEARRRGIPMVAAGEREPRRRAA